MEVISNPVDWSKIIGFLPVFEKIDEPSEVVVNAKPDGSAKVVNYKYHEDVINFLSALYNDDVLVDFDWSNWQKGNAILENKQYDLNTLSILEFRKLFTLIVRQDRFCEGLLHQCIKDGMVLKSLRIINSRVASS
jgi:hypothetical protein